MVQQNEGERRQHQAARGKRASAVAVREEAADRPRGQEPDGEGDHIDARPERSLLEAVAVQGEPDPLQPDDQHEHQTASA